MRGIASLPSSAPLRGQGAGTSASGAVGEPDPALAPGLEDLFGTIGVDAADLAGEIAGAMVDRFWDAGGDLAPVRIAPRAVAMPDAILRDLAPSNLAAGGRPIEDLLVPVYRSIAAAAIRIASGEAQEEALPDPGPAPDPAQRRIRACRRHAGHAPAVSATRRRGRRHGVPPGPGWSS